MKKLIFSSLLLLAFNIAYSQVGIQTPNPRGAMDINRPTTNTMGLILPTNSSTANMVNPSGGNIIPGTVMYDSTEDCIKYYKKTDKWSKCINLAKIAPTSLSPKTSDKKVKKYKTI